MLRPSIFVLLAGSTFAASAWAADAAPDGDAVRDDGIAEIVVTQRAQKLYRVDQTDVGKVPAAPLDVPQAVQIVNAQLIQDQGARDITDLYRQVPGISANNYATVTMRGFSQDVNYYDGLRGDPFQTFSVPQLFTIQRVEFLKGPAGMLYGPGAPGGAVNYVTKKPSDQFAANLRAIGGDYDRYGASGDVTGPLTADRAITGRAGVFYEHYDSFRHNAQSKTWIGDGGLGFRLAPQTKLVLQVTDYHQDLPGNRLRGIPVDENGHFLAKRSWNVNEKFDFIRYNGLVTQARLDSQLSDAWSFNASARWFDYHEFQEYHEPLKLVDTDDDGVDDAVTRQFRWQRRHVTGISGGSNLIGRFGGDDFIHHTVLAGADWYRENSDSQLKSTNDVPSLSLSDPQYGQTSIADYDLDALTPTLADARALRYGVYAQEQLGLGAHVIVVAGLRHDWFDDRDRETQSSYDDDATTKRFGLIVKPRSDMSLYVSWSDTFEPQDVDDQSTTAGGPFKPQTGSQVEGGIKTDLLDGRIQSTLAVYRIVRKNTLQVDDSKDPVDGVDQLAPIGEVTSKGIEASVTADLTQNWVLTGNYAYNDARITGSVDGQSIDHSVGDRFPNAPHQQAGLWTRYQIAPTGTALAAGLQYVSSQLDRDGDHLKGFTIADASATQSLPGGAEAMLRVENIFDRYYATSGFTGPKGAYVGRPRTVWIELRKHF
ncbi:TonB-dependent siderophore receptor [Solimonas marina]|uniref:TonB-dependent siderophore receptor n=1 Tax=Solimonas marina TaxID=2714601 RepID=A0A969WCT7_9GAMM|nr:TonB-dependent siderophore receptor [Solimonas marina]NKF23854.1 TonB-dependent siderophore receptor [Solimonas marina]